MTGAVEERLHILMAVCNGAATLPAQLDSLVAQSHRQWRLLASDDGSTDRSRAVLERFALDHPARVIDGPRRGFAANFLSLLAQAPQGPVALADQDDIWLPEKLERAMAHLARVDPAMPALYCSRRLVWDPSSDRRTLSRAYPRPPDFGNALVENIAPGNTIVLNAAAAALARRAAPGAGDIYAHDWWLYLLISGAGGTVIWDAEPTLLYRQHADNVIGAGEGVRSGLRNKLGVLRGVFADRVGRNVRAVEAEQGLLSPANAARLAAFAQARQAALPRRLALMRRAGVWRQGRLSTLWLWGAICLGRV